MEDYIAWTIQHLCDQAKGRKLADCSEMSASCELLAWGLLHRCTAKKVSLPTAEEARVRFSRLLEMVRGVGPVRAKRLRESEIETLEQLESHPYLAVAAKEAQAMLRGGPTQALLRHLGRKLGGQGRFASLLALGLTSPDEVAWLDLETLGLFNSVIFMAGVGHLEKGKLFVEQYLAKAPEEEPLLLERLTERLAAFQVVVTYNGTAADLPWLRQRLYYHGLADFEPRCHLDLFPLLRWRYVRQEPRLTSASLARVRRELLGWPEPVCEVPGWAVPHLYHAWMEKSSEGLLALIADHNRDDVCATATASQLLAEEALKAWT